MGDKKGGKDPETVIATYRVRNDREAEFLDILRRHYPVLKRLDLVTGDPPVIYRGFESGGGLIIYEIFTWKSGEAAGVAHEIPDVMKIWEAMGTLVEERDGRPKFWFPHVKKLDLAHDAG